MNIGIMGGAFDPIHVAHMGVAKGILDAGLVDYIRLMPCSGHLHGKKMESGNERLLMAMKANDVTGVVVDSTEVAYKHNGSTHDLFANTILPQSRTDDTYYCIIGLDNARQIGSWHRWEELLKITQFIVVRRAGEPDPFKAEWFMKRPHIYLDLKEKVGKMSSTEIRETIKTKGHKYAEKFLHPKVYNHIVEKQLYK